MHSLSTSKELPSPEEHYTTLFPATPTLASLLPILPPPTFLADFLATLATNFELNPRAMLGEIGLDKSFHLPRTTEPRGPLSDLSTPIRHQVEVVEAQIDVALRFGRNISLHSVRAPKDTLELLDRCKRKDRWGEINICLHSFGGSPESIRDIQKGASFLLQIDLCPANRCSTSTSQRLPLVRHGHHRPFAPLRRPRPCGSQGSAFGRV